MPKPAQVVARSHLRWLRMLKSCFILSAVLAFTACSFTNSSSNSATLIPGGSTAQVAKSEPAPQPQTSSAISAPAPVADQPAEIAVQSSDDNINAAEIIVAVEETSAPAADETAAAAPVVEAAASAAGPEVQMAEGLPVDAVSAEVMESALATIQRAEAHLDLIDKNLCTTGLSGNLVTGQAGQGFLRDHGIKSAYTLTGEIMPAPPSFEVAAAAEKPDPAPSAGTSEPTVNFASLNTSSLPASSGSSDKISKNGVTESLLMSAYEQTGRHYKNGGQNPQTGFDSSGFTRWVYAQRGLSLPKDASKQASGGRLVDKSELRPGDLLVYRDLAGEAGGYHVGIYTGQGNFLHADAKNGVVTETAAFGPQYAPNFVGGRRYFEDSTAAPLSDGQKMSATSSAVKLALSELGPNDKRPVAKKKPVKTASAKSSKKSKKSKGG